ncbi:MAG: prepilin peptidase [Aliishimia sp.]
MSLTQLEAWIYLPFVLPICLYVAFTDLREMRITNQAVLVLGGLFFGLGLLALPVDEYVWRVAQLGIVLVVGFILAALGAVGAGDAKFAAAAAPYIALGDTRLLVVIFTANLLAGVATHRIAKHTPLRQIAPHWESWDKEWDFPMGLSLGGTLAIYLGLAAIFGS